jgi:hypothetical protein
LKLEHRWLVFALGSGNVILFAQQTLQSLELESSLNVYAAHIVALEVRGELNLDVSRNQSNWFVYQNPMDM